MDGTEVVYSKWMLGRVELDLKHGLVAPRVVVIPGAGGSSSLAYPPVKPDPDTAIIFERLHRENCQRFVPIIGAVARTIHRFE